MGPPFVRHRQRVFSINNLERKECGGCGCRMNCAEHSRKTGRSVTQCEFYVSHKYFISLSSSSIPDKRSNDTEVPLTGQEVQRLEKLVDVLIESVFPDKAKQAREIVTNVVKTSLSSHPASKMTLNENTNSIVLDLPILAEPSLEVKPSGSPLSNILNHTFPNSLVELVNKLNKMSINPASFDFLNSNSNVPSPSTFPTNNPSSQSSTPLPPPPPSEDLIRQLINDYFNRFNVVIPIVDRRKFQEMCIKEKDSVHTKLLMNSILAVAARFSDDPSIQKSPEKPGGIFFDAAKKLLDNMYNVPKLETLQALLLISSSEVSIARVDSATMFLAMAGTILSESLKFFMTICLTNNSTFFPRWVSFMLGKPALIEDININVPLPTLASFESSTRVFFISWIKLSRILGEIWKFGYSSKPKACSANWQIHMADQKSTLRQIRAALAKWLKELPDELQYQYLPNTDPRSLIQLTRFSDFAGYINILFHVCMIVLHQPYLSQAKIGIQSQGSNGPINTCLTAAITITDIAKTTRKYDKDAFCNFQYVLYGLLQSSSIIGMTIMNGAHEYESTARKALRDAIEELKYAAESCKIISMQEIVKELEGVMRIANSNSSDIAIPFPLVLQILESRGSANNGGGGFGHAPLRNMGSGRDFGNNKLTSSPMSECSTASNSSIAQDDENSLKIKYPTPPSLTTNSTPMPMSPSLSPSSNHLSNQQADPNSFIFDTQDQTSLQFNQISSNIDQNITQDTVGGWNSPFFINDGLYELMNSSNSSNSLYPPSIIANVCNNSSSQQAIQIDNGERTL
ncbi:1285_t:CDS:2 [Acaulospora morrowiae]|uniref:1285_t:CDS:1 n=1 Tax=Acaulospora morrowiae TaxID=94023 RepID=A0A9N9FU62_9GLOM|nr:1285_t:CDS:2 [Acaulospora morrowiae]